ncbi:MAG TPA: EutN/CcmL family microcompartment protein [Tepidisphaeraceae bacterium]|jgi:ethanolamine utilization protein EutN|nr:EutN/CcmL family microcompartment protein [Tepidisphaeraceae bacterium]
MQWARVIGHATATIKHPSMNGLRMVLVQPLGVDKQPEADPQIAVDRLGSGPGQLVLLNLDGKAAREYVGDEKSPVRFFVIGIVDE